MINTKHKPLNKEDILKNISLKNYPRLSEIEILEKTESTNNEAKDIFHKLNKNETSFCFIAEEQTSGRGTKGRKWISPHGTNIYLSLAWKSSIPIKEAIPWSPRLIRSVIKFAVTCPPKKATLGPNNISAKTETPKRSTPSSINCLK